MTGVIINNNNKKVNSLLAVDYHWKLWIAIGIQPPKRTSKWFIPYITYTIIAYSMILFLPISYIINLIHSKNMTELCENICNTTADVISIVKVFNVIAIRHKLREVGKILNHLDARVQTHKEVAILEEGIALARQILLVFGFFCFVFDIFAQIYAFTGRTLVYPVWIPWNYTSSETLYIMTQLCMFFATSLAMLQNVVNDTYPVAYLIILSSQIKALASRIRDLGTDNTCSEDILYGKLRHCIQDHNSVYRLSCTIEESISTACLFQFTATGLSQCTLAVYVLYVGIQPAKILHCFFFLTAITIEIFILCYYGEIYCPANDHLTESIYACNWMDRDKKFKKALLLLLQRSQKSSAIMACVLIPINLPTFFQILKTAYSVFAVLNHVSTK